MVFKRRSLNSDDNMNFYFVVVVIVLLIYQVGCVGPNQIPQQPSCVIGQQPLQQVPLVQPQPPHVPQQWSQQPFNALQPPPPFVIGQQPLPQQVPPIPVPQQALPQAPLYPVQQLQQNYVSQPLPQQPWPQQPCNTLQQPPFNPQNPVMTFPPQPGAIPLEQQNMLPQSYPPQYPQPYPQPPGYPQQPGAYPGGYYPPVPGAYPGVNPVYPVNPAGSSCPIPSGQQLPGPADPKPEKPSPTIPPLDKRRHLIWCTCPTCKDVVPILLKGNKTQKAVFGKLGDPNEEEKFRFSDRIKECNRPKVDIALCNHAPPCNIVKKILMLFY